MFNADKPITQIKEDKLGRSSFACQLANAIIRYGTKDNYAISLQGKWGCGKTSVLNMAIEEIKRLSESLPEENRIVIVQFNPWNFTDTTQLISQFFVTLSNSLKFDNKEENRKDVGTVIEEYSSALEYSEYIPVVGKYLKLLPKLSAKLGKSVKESAEKKLNDVSYRKNEVEKALRKLDLRILVVIDDIDRLPNEQIRLVFQLVSAVAGLPNITYLLSFDNEIVARALGEVQHCDGEEYLEKIIQVPFDMPPVDISKVHRILFEKLNDFIEIYNGQEFNSKYWSKIFHSCISPFIKTLRDINRFYNTLSFMYAGVKEEIDFIDLAGVCALRIFASPIYEWIRDNWFSLVGGYGGGGITLNDVEKRKEEYLQRFSEVYPNDPEIMLNAVASLFPSFSNKISYQSDFTTREELHQAMRVASEAKFDIYFTLSLDNIKISRQEVDRSLFEMEEPELRAYINSLKERELFGAYFSEVQYNLSRIPRDRIELILSVLMFRSGRICNNKDTLTSPNSTSISVYTLSDILFRIDEEDMRYALIKSMLSNTDFLAFQSLLYLLHIIELTHGRIAETSRAQGNKLVTIEHLYELEKIFLERMKLFLQTTNLLDWDEARRASMLWEFLDKETYKAYLTQALLENTYVLNFISLCAEKWTSSDRTYSYSFSNKSYEEFIDTARVIDAINVSRMTDAFWALDDRVIEASAAFSLGNQELEQEFKIDVSAIKDKLNIWQEEFRDRNNTPACDLP